MKALLLLSFLLFARVESKAQFGMPSIREVVNTYFSLYDDYAENEVVPHFYRKKEGWYVAQASYLSIHDLFDETLFWSFAQKKYLPLNQPAFSGDPQNLADKISHYIQWADINFNEYHFQRSIYFGYDGWHWDTILESPQWKEKNDTLLESIARAYSSYGGEFMVNGFGNLFENDDPDRSRLGTWDTVSESRIEKFIFYCTKSIDTYKKLLSQNPSYEVRVGNVRIKLANEHMFIWGELTMAGKSSLAKKYALMADYPDTLLNTSRQYLDALPDSALLLTHGDNDTYPLWYLQQVENHRPDVQVINFSMLSLPRYVAQIARETNFSIFTCRDSVYAKPELDYSLFSNPGNPDAKIELSVFCKHLVSGNNPYNEIKTNYIDNPVSTYYAKTVFYQKAPSSVVRTIHLSDYILRNDYLLLDIIQTASDRPLFSTAEYPLIAEFTELHGPVLKINR